MDSKKTKIQQLNVDENKRIIVISDIHGEVTYLDGVLKKANYSENDILVIIGDMIEKGRESLKTVRYILNLMERNPNVYVTMGNVDYDRIATFMNDSPEGNSEFIGALYWTRDVWKRGFFLDILDELGINLQDVCEENITAIKKQIRGTYQRELEFLWNLPTILTLGEYIFVHGGIPTDDLEELQDTDAFEHMKINAFMDRNVRFKKMVVVGHWPTCLYRKDSYCMNPMFDYEKRIITIDGGCAIKKNGGQLNALIIPNAYADMREVSYVTYDDYPIIIAQKAQHARKSTIEIRFFDCEVELLEEKHDIVSLKYIKTGKVFDVPKSHLWRRDDKLCCIDYTDMWLEVAEGDMLSLLEENAMGMIVKKDGVVGWYTG